jgi:tRNA threonylcarbamoyl adenosine modification protein YeaZ
MILALDTSLADLHIGLFSDEAKPLAEFHHIASADDRHIHDALLAQSTSNLLKEISASPRDISKIALIIGPGSFTGLRIGLSFAKGLAYGSDASIIPLKAHRVLWEQCENKKEKEKNAILYPGYEKDSVYLSMTNDPENIRYIKLSEVQQLHITEIISPIEVDLIGFRSHISPIRLITMAEITLTIDPPPPIADLEPFYGTDFKTNVK